MSNRTPHYADELCNTVLLPYMESSIKRFVEKSGDLLKHVIQRTGQINGESSMIGPSNVPPAWRSPKTGTDVERPARQAKRKQLEPPLPQEEVPKDVSGWKFRFSQVTKKRLCNKWLSKAEKKQDLDTLREHFKEDLIRMYSDMGVDVPQHMQATEAEHSSEDGQGEVDAIQL